MITVIKNKIELDNFITENGDYNPEADYIAQDRESKECFAITGCTYASEAFDLLSEQYQLVTSDDDYYSDKIEQQLNSEHPEMNPFFLDIFERQNAKLIEFDKTFDPDDFTSCVNRAMLLIKNLEAQMIEDDYEWPIDTDSCKWSIENRITNRSSDESMMFAAIMYVEEIELQAESFNNV